MMRGGGGTTDFECRSDRECSARFHEKRVPSYCDRILHSRTAGVDDWQVVRYGVVELSDGDEDSGIPQSDHDAVYAIADAVRHDVSMLVVTFNCAGQGSPPAGWQAFFSVLESNAGQSLSAFAAVVVCLQESTASNTLRTEMQEYMDDQAGVGAYGVHKSVTVAGRSVVAGAMGSDYKVRCVAALRGAEYEHAAVEADDICLGPALKRMACTKGAAGLCVVNPGDVPGFCAVAAHLPIDTSDKQTLGYAERVKALRQVAKHFCGQHSHWCVIAGDLNFRSHLGGWHNDELVKSAALLEELDLVEPRPTHPMTPTCKLRSVPAIEASSGSVRSSSDLDTRAMSEWGETDEDDIGSGEQTGGQADRTARAWFAGAACVAMCALVALWG